MASEKISHVAKTGVYQVVCSPEGLEIFCSYTKRQKDVLQEVRLSEVDLEDLRARALLSGEDSKADKATMSRFAQEVDALKEFCSSLRCLREEGFLFAREETYKASNLRADAVRDLKQLQQKSQNDLAEWRSELEAARAQYRPLSFVYSTQFWLLADFLRMSLGQQLDSSAMYRIGSELEASSMV